MKNKVKKLLIKSVIDRTKDLNNIKWSLYLSGGIDSSIIACVAKPKIVFSFGFEDDEISDRELYYSTYIADYIKAEHVVKAVTKNEFEEHKTDIIKCLDQPCITMGAIPQYLLAKEARERGMKVMLTGQGSDELFGGYVRYLVPHHILTLGDDEQIEGYEALVKKTIDNVFHMQADNKEMLYLALIDNKQASREDRGRFHLIYNNNKGDLVEPIDKMMNFDFVTSLRGLLTVDDRVNSAFAIETRSPFLDNDLVDYVSRIPLSIKMKGNKLKYLLREAFRGVVPDLILDRKDKVGIAVPFNKWYGYEGLGFNRKMWNELQVNEWKNIWGLNNE